MIPGPVMPGMGWVLMQQEPEEDEPPEEEEQNEPEYMGLNGAGSYTLTCNCTDTYLFTATSIYDGGAVINLYMPKPSLLADAYDGQYDPDHPSRSFVGDKIKRGAITVANMNDSNGNGVPDSTEWGHYPANDPLHPNDVRFPNGDPDLIRVTIYKPAGMTNNDTVHIAVTGDNQTVKIWQDNQKLSSLDVRDIPGSQFDHPPNPIQFKDIWIEGLDKSTAVKDHELKITFGDKFDIIKLTFVLGGI